MIWWCLLRGSNSAQVNCRTFVKLQLSFAASAAAAARFTGEALEDEGIGMFGDDDDEVRPQGPCMERNSMEGNSTASHACTSTAYECILHEHFKATSCSVLCCGTRCVVVCAVPT